MRGRTYFNADQLVKTCRAVFNQGDDFVKKIAGKAKAWNVFGDLPQLVTQLNGTVAV